MPQGQDTPGVYPGLDTSPEKEKSLLAYPATSTPQKEKTSLPTYPDLSQEEDDEEDLSTTGSWQRGKGVLSCNRHMLEKQLACDVWFTVGCEREKIGAHRYVLQSRSGVFFAMLDGPGADRTHFDLPNASPKVFWQLLRYMYFEELYPDSETVFQLLSLAEKYDVAAVKDICLRFLPGCLTVGTACDVLETAHHHDDQELEQECLLYIRKHGDDVVQSQGMERLCRECLNKVLTMEGLDAGPVVRKEVTDRWARRQCEDKLQEPSEDNKLEELGDVLYVKRDQKHSHRYILDSVTDRQLSGDDSATDPPPLYSELSVVENGEDVPDDASMSSMSSAGSRRSLHSQFSRQLSYASWPDLNNVTRFREVDGSMDCDGSADGISFTVDRNIYLYGFGIYGSKSSGEAAYKVDTIVTRKKRDLVMESISISGAGVILPVMFERAVKIEKGKVYTLEIYIQGPPCHEGTDGQGTVTDGRTTFKFSNADKRAIKGNRTTIFKGQIPRFYFVPY